MRLTVRMVIALFATGVMVGGHGAFATNDDKPTPTGAKSRNSRVQEVRRNAEFGTGEIVSGEFKVAAGKTKVEKARAFVGARADVFKIAQPEKELELLSERTDKLGMTHLRFQQVYEGLPVWSCQAIVHFKDDETIYMVGGQVVPTPGISTTPAVTKQAAMGEAVSAIGEKADRADLSPAAELVIYPFEGASRLVWLTTVTSPTDGSVRWRVFVDAQTGEVIDKFNDIHFDGPDTGSGPDVLGVNKTFPIYLEFGQYEMRDVTRTGEIITYENLYGGGPISTDPDGDKIWDDNVGQRAAVSGHVSAALTYDYFLSTFGRDSYDGFGSNIIANVHDSAYVNNAYWNGSGVNFADGDGVNYRPFSGSLDVVAHEIAHGVTEHTANLIYRFQSGALNESYSDVFGSCVDRDDWLLGEDIRITAPGFIRSMEDPSLRGQPEHMNDYLYYPIETDNGGVHINSGIPNYAFYWAASLTSREVAEQIWYRTLTTYLTPSSGMFFWSAMTLQSAADLYGPGSSEYTNTALALSLVGFNGTYATPDEMTISGIVGEVIRDTVWVHNPTTASVDVSVTVPAIFTGVTVSNPSFSLGSNDSTGVEFVYDASTLDSCDVGMFSDFVEITTTGPSYTTNILLPTSLAAGYTTTSIEPVSIATSCLSMTGRNTSGLSALVKGGVNALYDGSLLVGLVDGADTSTYRDVFGVEKLVPVDTVGGGAASASFRLASMDGRIQGTVTYRWYTGLDSDTCDFVVVEYSLKNVCDTALKVFIGLFSDLDIVNSGNNTADFDAGRGLVYMRDNSSQRFAGFALLSGTPRNLRAINNPNLVWSGKFTDRVAYRELAATANVSGPSYNDYSILLSFGADTLGPGTTADYAVALVYSSTGLTWLQQTVDVAHAWWGGPIYVSGDANGDGSVSLADAVFIINYVFKGGAAPSPLCLGDANCDGSTDLADAVYLINYVFKGGPQPVADCCP